MTMMMLLLLLLVIHVSTIEITASVTGIGTTKHGECVNFTASRLAGDNERNGTKRMDGRVAVANKQRTGKKLSSSQL
jgi:hypothetical protein